MKKILSALASVLLLSTSIAFADEGTGEPTQGPDGTTVAEMMERQGGAEFAPEAVATPEDTAAVAASH